MPLSPMRSRRRWKRSYEIAARRLRAPPGAIFGAIILVASLDEAVPLIDALAPEHLEIDRG